MPWSEVVRIALSSLRANKLRSFLTMLGIVIGIAAVIAMIALGNGAQRSVQDRIAALATTADYPLVHRYELDLGRFFTAREDTAGRRVAVLGAAVLDALGVDDPLAVLDQDIRIRGILFHVIGVLKSKGSASSFENPDEQILIPYNAARFRVFGSPYLGDIFVVARDEASIPTAMAEIQHWMRRSHRLRADQPDDFRIRSQTDFLQTMGETAQVFTALLAGIAAVSLVVGGIGIMNIMLVSVTERTREIGVRKALGATRRTILTQFLLEAVVLCVAGGAVGIGLGIAASTVLQRALGWSMAVAPTSIGLAFGFAALVGIVFGVWPARRAAQLDPIVALRHE
jgi:putative ABC transport system permease protein